MSERYPEGVPISPNNPAIGKDEDICTNCSHCLAVCAEEIGVAQPRRVTEADDFTCIHRDQRTAAYPEWAIRVKSQWRGAAIVVNDQQKIVVSSTAPSVRVGLGECFNGELGDFVESYIVSTLRKPGTDFVLDVAFSADLTITEEGAEFPKRLIADPHPLPQFISCRPAWVKYIETFHPERIPCLSSTKSPISMQGALIKIYFSKEKGIDPRRIVSIAVAPCTAKRSEISREELCPTGTYLGIPGPRDSDYVLTTRELTEWIRKADIGFHNLAPSASDPFMGGGSGAGMIFGNTGGVMEAALCMAYSVVNGIEPFDLLMQYQPARELERVKESVVPLSSRDMRTAVVYDTRAAKQLTATGAMDDYDFAEAMACSGGCISDKGQSDNGILPVPDRLQVARIRSLYLTDQERSFRNSLESQEIKRLYEAFIGEPMGRMAQLFLHTSYHSRKRGIQMYRM